jgi:hypothetical protein
MAEMTTRTTCPTQMTREHKKTTESTEEKFQKVKRKQEEQIKKQAQKMTCQTQMNARLK